MTLLSIFILSLVEGVTEFLPISSTAHLLITSQLLNIESTAFLSSFLIFIQLGAIGAVLSIYQDRLRQNLTLIKKVIVAFLPTSLIGLLLYPIIKNFFLESLLVVAWALLVGGVVIILFEWWYKNKTVSNQIGSLADITYKQALLIGLFQSLAVVPGASRAGSTILGGLFLGLSRVVIVEFSFLLAIPTMLGATSYDLFKTSVSFSGLEFFWLFLGFGLSFLFALVAIKWLVNFIKSHDFTYFGVYRILLALLILAFLV